MIGRRGSAGRVPTPDRYRVALVVLVIALVVNLGGFAYAAYLTTSGSGAAQSRAETLSAPTHLRLQGAVTAASVPLAWSPPSAPAPTGFVVYRCIGTGCTPVPSGVVTRGGCATSAGHPLTAPACADDDPALAAGTTYGYAVAALYHTWLSPQSAPLQVGTPDRPGVTDPSSAAPVAPTVTAQPPPPAPTGLGATTRAPVTPAVAASVSDPAPGAGIVGSSAAVAAKGFAPRVPLTVTVGGAVATVTAGGTAAVDGGATVTFTVPAVRGGAEPVVVSAGTTSVTSLIDFSVQAAIVLSPAQGAAGSVLAISGTGFSAGTPVTAIFGKAPAKLGGMTTTSTTGSFTGATLTVPAEGPGSFSVLVTDAAGLWASASYMITAPPPPSP